MIYVDLDLHLCLCLHLCLHLHPDHTRNGVKYYAETVSRAWFTPSLA